MTNTASSTSFSASVDSTNPNGLAERYLAMWNATDPTERRGLINDLCAPGVRYIDPLADVMGRDQLDALIAAVQQQFPGFTFTLNGNVDAHHAQARFGWDLGPTSGPAPVAGFDVITVDEAGQLRLVLGFLDRVPSA
jgi:SnoaL-like domain